MYIHIKIEYNSFNQDAQNSQVAAPWIHESGQVAQNRAPPRRTSDGSSGMQGIWGYRVNGRCRWDAAWSDFIFQKHNNQKHNESNIQHVESYLSDLRSIRPSLFFGRVMYMGCNTSRSGSVATSDLLVKAA